MSGAVNVLVTSAGRRVGLLAAFRDAVHARGGRVVVADMDGLAPAAFAADAAERVPAATDSAFIPALLDIVARHRVGLLVPTIDTELQTLADHAADFADAGCRVAGSTPALVRTAGDKWLTFLALRDAGVPTIPSWLPTGDLDGLPDGLFVKPRAGSASAHTYHAQRETLTETLARVPDPVIQAFVRGEEITVDVLFDRDGALLHYVPRRRIRTVGGESIQGVTLGDDALRMWLDATLAVLGGLGARGPVTVQAFRTEAGFLLLEVNPRFGGGFPLGHAAGGRYPEWLVAMAAGEAVRPVLGDYTVGLYMTRHYAETFTAAPLWP